MQGLVVEEDFTFLVYKDCPVRLLVQQTQKKLACFFVWVVNHEAFFTDLLEEGKNEDGSSNKITALIEQTEITLNLVEIHVRLELKVN